MTYTNEEIRALRENCTAIETWICENITPCCRETIHVEFGEVVTRRGYGGWPVREMEYELCVNQDGPFGGNGGLSMRCADEVSYKGFKGSGTIFLYSDRGFAAPYIAALVQEWPRIKRELLFAVKKQSAGIASIMNFVV